ncbi:restriction endonuclease [Streptomyces sp. SudanB182_2057]|uniref:restriction endonuclease n=1 Tax=Streptomyces sp. SudanB182_2057 TaxID=3035281 RepID=UPI003F54C10D
MYVASAGSPAILWFLPLVLLASTTAGWLLATKHHRRQQSTVFQCQRSCCSPARVDGLDHREFEYLVRDLMIRDGATNVRRVGGAGDNGADVMATDPAGQLWIIQCKHRKQGLGGKMVGVQELQVLNGTGRPVHKGNVVVLVTNGAVSRRAHGFAKSQKLEIIDRLLLEDWIAGDRPAWDLLGLKGCTAPSALSYGESEALDGSSEPVYSLAEAYNAGLVPWKPATMRQYLLRSQRRGIPLPRSRDGLGHLYTAAELGDWLGHWRAQGTAPHQQPE